MDHELLLIPFILLPFRKQFAIKTFFIRLILIYFLKSRKLNYFSLKLNLLFEIFPTLPYALAALKVLKYNGCKLHKFDIKNG